MPVRKTIIFLICILFLKPVYGQEKIVADDEELKSSESGFIIEYGLTKLKQTNELKYYAYDYSSTYTERGEEQNPANSSIGFYYSHRYFLGNNVKLEIKPGIILADFPFSGLECGLFLRYNLFAHFFIAAGINTHFTLKVPNDEGNSHSYSTTLFFLLPTISVGYDFSRGFSSILSFFTYTGDDYLTNRTNRNFVGYNGDRLLSTTETKNIRWGLKLGVEIKL